MSYVNMTKGGTIDISEAMCMNACKTKENDILRQKGSERTTRK